MTAFVDTNVLIRHLTGEPPDIAERANSFLAAAGPLLLTDTDEGEVASFDKGLDRVGTIRRIEP